jgi:hypothetical protein
VTGVVRSIRSVPKQLSELPGAPLVVRGEVYMPRVEFDRLNYERAEVNLCVCLQSFVLLLTSKCAMPNSLECTPLSRLAWLYGPTLEMPPRDH